MNAVPIAASPAPIGKRHPYPAYRESGVEWLGEIPQDWRCRPLKYITAFINGAPFKPSEWSGEGVPIIRIENLNSGDEFNYTQSHVDPRYEVHEGDLLFGWSGNRGTSFGPFIWKRPGHYYLNQHIFRLTGYKVKKAWFYWALKAVTVFVEKQAHGIIGMVHITKGDLGAIPIPEVTPDEQQAIAAFLDRETAKIDALISKREQLIALLDEKRAALISRAVTNGLDRSVPMKDSGIEWLGKIPAHWLTPPLYARYQVQLGKMLDSKRITGTRLAPYLRNVDVQWDSIGIEDLPKMDFSESDRERFALRRGDLLVCEGGEVGRTAVWHGELEECYYQKAIHRLRPKNGEDWPRYFFYVMYAASKLGVFRATGNPNTIDHLTAEKLRAHRFPFPPSHEQSDIVEFLDRRVREVQKLQLKCHESIGTLQEFRTALISAAVTGKIDVRGELQ
jgi:type I restriction enzyme S subunit